MDIEKELAKRLDGCSARMVCPACECGVESAYAVNHSEDCEVINYLNCVKSIVLGIKDEQDDA